MIHPPAFFQYDFEQDPGVLTGQNGWVPSWLVPGTSMTTTATEARFLTATEAGAQVDNALDGMNLELPWFIHMQWRYTPRLDGDDNWYVVMGDESSAPGYLYFGAGAGGGLPHTTWTLRDPLGTQPSSPLLPRAVGEWTDVLCKFTGGALSIEYQGEEVLSSPWAGLLGIGRRTIGLYQQAAAEAPGDVIYEIRHLAVGAL